MNDILAAILQLYYFLYDICSMTEKITLFWFRRDLRIYDNTGFHHALSGPHPVLPIFIFDTDILETLHGVDRRIEFILFHLKRLQAAFIEKGSSLLVLHGRPLDSFKQLLATYQVSQVVANSDYEPSGIKRDEEIQVFLKSQGVHFSTFKDHVIFEKSEIVKKDGTPYTVFTPYSGKWKEAFYQQPQVNSIAALSNLYKTHQLELPGIQDIGFVSSGYQPGVPVIHEEIIENYHKKRNLPGIEGTSRLGVHLRFGTLSIRELAGKARQLSQVYLEEIIWREFFVMILFQYPHVQHRCFRPEYDNLEWRNNTEEFSRWCRGETGFPIVDAGMRELNATGFMHNRVRMITAGFLTKDLLIDWRWGEAWFAGKLLDYELASNNGNWQWAAGTGCDAAPYFRIFNPEEQTRKFDPQHGYISRWVPEYKKASYPKPVVDHRFARARAIAAYKNARLI